MFNSKKLTLILLIALFSMATLYPISASAQISSLYSYSYSGIKPFGGTIINMEMCTIGIMLEIGPPVSGQYLLTDSTTMYSYGVFAPGVWVLGNADTSTVVCKGNGGGASTVGTVMTVAAVAIAIYGVYYSTAFAVGDAVIQLSTIGTALGIGGLVSKFGFGKKLKTLGHPHPIQMVGTSF